MRPGFSIVSLIVAAVPSVLFGQTIAEPPGDPLNDKNYAKNRLVSLTDEAPPPSRSGSPSNGTATVSASTAPQTLDREIDSGDGADVTLGGVYIDGDFGTNSNTTIWSSALAGRYTRGNLRLNASLPWMQIRSRATVFTGIDSTVVVVAPDTNAARRKRSGFGDLTLGASYTLLPAAATEIELSGRVKLNTASNSSGLSSGETDYSLGAQVTQSVGRFAPFASITYRFLGDSARWRLRDGIAASAGSSLLLGDRSVALVSYHYARSATAFVRDSHEVFGGVSTRIADSRWRLSAYATKGLSNGAADVSAGLGIALGF